VEWTFAPGGGEGGPQALVVLTAVLGRDSFQCLEDQDKVVSRSARAGAGKVEMDYLDFIARVTAHIPDKGQSPLHSSLTAPLSTA
jgi:hypothetical protein